MLTNDSNVISNGFCDFYKNVGKNFASKIAASNKDFSEYMPDPCDSSLFQTQMLERKK